MPMLRRLLGEALRRERLAQHRTLREVSSAARVSLGYLSEVERGQKEASSELLASICDALEVRLSEVLREVSDDLAVAEGVELVPAGAEREPGLESVPLAPLDMAAVERVAVNRVSVDRVSAAAGMGGASAARVSARPSLGIAGAHLARPALTDRPARSAA